MLRQAQKAHRDGKAVAAEALYREALATIPAQAADIHRCLGILKAQTGSVADAIEQLSASLRLAPAQPGIVSGLVGLLVQSDRADEAIAVLRQAEPLWPQAPDLPIGLGNLLAGKDDHVAAAEAYRRALSLTPEAAHVHVNLGVMLQQLGNHEGAALSLTRALALDPASFQAQFNLGVVRASQRRFDAAAVAYRGALRLYPDATPALVNLGKALEALDHADEAIACFQRAVALDPDLAEAHEALGAALAARGKPDDAVAAFRTALRIHPGAVPLHLGLGLALEQKGEIPGALECYRRAIALDPAQAAPYNNLALALCGVGSGDEAVPIYRQALEREPRSAQIHLNLGTALGALGRLEEAVACYRRAIALDGDFAAAHFSLGLALRDQGHLEEAFVAFRRHAALRYGTSARGGRAPPPPSFRTRHDREQLDYLVAAKIVDGAAPEIAAGLADDAALAAFFDGFHHLEGGARLASGALDPRNARAAVEAAWAGSRPEIVVLDDFLTPEALAELRRFCWGSTIWRQIYSHGYLGALLETGLACPLLAQIAEELPARFPGIFGTYPLTHYWAFKYDRTLKGTAKHADLAEINVNFWIAPDEACLDPASGGLVIWDKPAPADWHFRKYNTDDAAICDFLARSEAEAVRVPHRANRAVIFHSGLFHETDRISFKDGYVNRRINVTLLYGRRATAR